LKTGANVLGRRIRAQSAILGLLIGVGCLGVLIRQVDLKQSWNTLSSLNGPYLLVPLAAFLINIPLRAWRWQLIFPLSSRPDFGTCLSTLGIGNMANFLLPGRAGDMARCVLLDGSPSWKNSSRTLATLIVEKVFDGLALIAMALLSVWFLHPPSWVLALLRVAVLIFGSAVVFLFFAHYRKKRLLAAVRLLFRALHLSSLEEKFDGLLGAFVDGLVALGSGSQLVVLLAMTAAIWSTEAVLVLGLGRALGLAVSLHSAVVASAMLGLGLMIPAAPGGLGTYELFGAEAFKLTGLSASEGLALTLVIHAWVFVTNVALGTLLLGIKGISLTQLRTRVDVDSQMETPIQPSI
jgi:glycosyltransferase 2 family protein